MADQNKVDEIRRIAAGARKSLVSGISLKVVPLVEALLFWLHYMEKY